MHAGIVWCPHCGSPHPLGTKICPNSAKSLDRGVNKNARAESHELVGQTLGGKYLVTRLIGTGGMGAVFEAENRLLRRMVAIKVVNATATPEAVARLEREALLVSAVQHPNICDVYDVGVLKDGTPFIVLERLYGETLSDLLRRKKNLTAELVVEIFTQLLSGLQAAHGAKIIHRDLKPRNVFLVDRLGCPPLTKLVDFGFAADISGLRTKPITRPGSLLGTMRYMSPEHVARAPIDHRTDLFAVGIMLYEALAGRHPYEHATLGELQAKLGRGQPTALHELRPEVSPELSAVVARALATRPEDRWQSAVELQRALADTLRRESFVPDSIPPRSRTPDSDDAGKRRS